MVTVLPSADGLALPVARRRRSVERLARTILPRRLWDLTEVAEILNRGGAPGERPRYSVEKLRSWVARGDLPVVVLPSPWAADVERPGWRTYRVPDVWIADWFAMRGPGEPLRTERADLGAPDDPPWLKIADAAMAVGLSHTTMNELVNLGIVRAHIDPSGGRLVSTRALDDWVFSLIEDAEDRWYAGREKMEAESA